MLFYVRERSTNTRDEQNNPTILPHRGSLVSASHCTAPTFDTDSLQAEAPTRAGLSCVTLPKLVHEENRFSSLLPAPLSPSPLPLLAFPPLLAPPPVVQSLPPLDVCCMGGGGGGGFRAFPPLVATVAGVVAVVVVAVVVLFRRCSATWE